MADIIVDGRVRVAFLPTIADPALNPTLAELQAGTLLQKFLVPTGLEGFETSQADVDNSSLASTFDTKLPGRKSYSGTRLMFKKQSGTDPVFTLLGTEYTDGFIVIRDELLESVDWAVSPSQRLEIYPGRTGEHQIMGRDEANSVLRYGIPWAISAPPNKKAFAKTS